MAFRTSVALHHVIGWTVERNVRQFSPERGEYIVTTITIKQKDPEGRETDSELIMFGPIGNTEVQ